MPKIDGLNLAATKLCESVSERSDELRVFVSETDNGAKLYDFGASHAGTIEGGIELSRICLADRAKVSLVAGMMPDLELDGIQVETEMPFHACIAAQYAGWPFSTENLFAMCSGPARLKRGKEDILKSYNLATDDVNAVGILETNLIPVETDIAEFSEECKCDPENVSLCLARTSSLPGAIQVVSRSVETAMHKLFELGFDLTKVKKGIGRAPIPPQAKDDYVAMGWTNDAILYGGDVHLWLDEVSDLEEFVNRLPSRSSEQFGRPFKDIFEEYDRDFYKVDRMLFSPARVTITCLSSGKSAIAGEVRNDLIESSFRSEINS